MFFQQTNMIASVADPQTVNALAGTNLLKNSIKLSSIDTVKRSENKQRNFVALALIFWWRRVSRWLFRKAGRDRDALGVHGGLDA